MVYERILVASFVAIYLHTSYVYIFVNDAGEPYGEPFTQGDVIGVHIYLPSPYNKNKKKKNKGKGNKNRRKSLSSHTSDSTYNRSQNQQHLLALLDIGSSRRGTQTWMGLPLAGSRITFYKNGISQGVAFKDISRGTYYPAVSNYLFARSKMNFGPTYLFPPQDLDLDKMRDQWMINNPHLRGQIALGDPFSTSVFYPVRRTRNTTSTSQAHNSSSSNGSSNSSSSNHKDSSSSSSSSSNGENGRSTGKKNKENEKVKFGAWQGQCKDSVLVRNPNHKFTHAQAQ